MQWLALGALVVLPSLGVSLVLLLRSRHPRPLPRFTRIPALKLLQLAVLIAGQGRAASISAEWRSHLSGETGQGLTATQQIRAACGFVLASVCYRAQDAVDLWWKLADKVLESRRYSNAVVWLPTLFAVVLVIRHDGLYGVVTHYESLASLCGSLFLTIRFGRKWRGAKPPQRKPGRDK
jgi:hypothetical protein